ncbi:MAG TPA: hypothetical protein VG538_14270 [Vicinamibacterales bacterium]|nr:hypothetical protein [Vicinamibacterales bacterium]
MVDDDVLLQPWALEDAKDEVALVGHEDPREWRFFETRQEALQGAHCTDVDLLATHGSLLGRRLADILTQGAPALETACQHMIAAVQNPGDLTIRLTFAGLAGDSARYCATRLLLSRGRIRQQLLFDVRSLALATTTREVHWIPTRLSITHDAACVGYCMGLLNVDTLPPFLPVGRNEDGVFGLTLRTTDDRSLSAHLPFGVIHDSRRSSHYSADEVIPSARHLRPSDALMSLTSMLRGATPPIFDLSAGFLPTVGRTFIAWSDLDAQDLAMLVAEAGLRFRCPEIAASSDRCVTGGTSNNDLYTRKIDDYREVFLESAARHDFWPFDHSTHGSHGEFRQLLRAWGRLLMHWTHIRDCALAYVAPSTVMRF